MGHLLRSPDELHGPRHQFSLQLRTGGTHWPAYGFQYKTPNGVIILSIDFRSRTVWGVMQGWWQAAEEQLQRQQAELLALRTRAAPRPHWDAASSSSGSEGSHHQHEQHKAAHAASNVSARPVIDGK